MDVLHVNYIDKTRVGSGIIAFYANKEERLKPGHVSGPIIRDCFVFQYVRAGKGTLQINDNSFAISEGQMYVTFPGAVTTMTADETDPWSKAWVCMQGEKVHYILNLLGIDEEHPVFTWNNKKEVLDYILYTIDELKAKDDEVELNRSICGNQLFKILLKLNGDGEGRITSEEKQSAYITRALQFIEYNFSRAITVDQIADYVGLNRTYFSSLFKEKTGMSPHKYLIDYKIKKACEYFENPSSTVASVGNSIGYEPQVFSRLFKTQTGLTPMQYIKKIKG